MTSSRSIKTQKRTRPISSHVDRIFYTTQINFPCGNTTGNPEPARPFRKPIRMQDLLQPYNKLTEHKCALWIITSVSSIQWHGTLKVLDISSNRGVDDECMELLSNFGMPKLWSLDLNNTNITSDGVR